MKALQPEVQQNRIPLKLYAIVIEIGDLQLSLRRRSDLAIGYNPGVWCRHPAGIANRVILINF